MPVRTDNDRQTDPSFWLPAFPVRQETVPHHSQFSELWGRLTLHIKLVTPLFVGSGGVGIQDGRMFYRFASSEGNLIIPASSLKGALRSMVEALSPSCLGVIKDGKYEDACQVDDPLDLCPACGLFGALGYQGRLTFEDAYCQPDAQTQVVAFKQRSSPRWAAADTEMWRDAKRSFNWRKFYTRDLPAGSRLIPQDERVEQVLDGATFETGIMFRSLRPWELGLLLLSMGIVPGCEFNWKLGGGKNRGLGLVRFNLHIGCYSQARQWLLGERENAGRRVAEWANAYWQKSREGWGMEEKIKEIATELRQEYGWHP